jgi:mono/diheme cytochrome c family protein
MILYRSGRGDFMEKAGLHWGGTITLFMVVIAATWARADTRELVQRGDYLVRVTGCVGCHSPRDAKDNVVEARRLTGGDRPRPAVDLWRFFPPNLTSDEETGIGTWSAADIVTALKTGVMPDGRIMSSAMPWATQFKDLDDADALAIATYLKTLAPVRYQVPAPLPPLKTPAQ